ncbi:MAG: hypothetical protein R2809_03060 [Flavobacteriales bacterium]
MVKTYSELLHLFIKKYDIRFIEIIEAMLDFCKEILVKVSFDRFLFRKELNKAIKRLKTEELKSLYQWCIDQFGSLYGDIIASSFRTGLA